MTAKQVEGNRSSERVKLTERFVNAVESSEGKKLYLDTTRTGFGLVVSAGGAKSYICLRRVPGHGQVRYKFANVGEYTVAEARARAAQILGRMSMGENPVQQRREARARERVKKASGVTLRQALERHQEYLRSKRRSERTIDDGRSAVEKYLADWLDRELVSLTREDVHRKHIAIANGVARGRFKRDKWRKRGEGFGRATANAVMRTFRSVWNRVARHKPEVGICPTIGVDWFTLPQRKCPIGTAGLADLWTKITAIENEVRRDLWRAMLFTGLRKKTACEMRWADIDLKAATVHIPNPKGGEDRAFTLPIPTDLVGVLKARQLEHAKLCGSVDRALPWVFPSPDAESGHIEEIRDDGLGVAPHDARRLFITIAESTDASPYAIKLLVNHALPRGDVTAGYMQIDVERLRPVMEQIASKMRALCEPRPAKVLPMRGRKKHS